MVNLNQSIFALILAGFSVNALAKDLGVQGTIYPIVERDIREILLESAAKVDWDKIQKGMVKRAETFGERLTPFTVGVAKQTETLFSDPSIETTEDIYGPVRRPNGSYAWDVIIPKGTKKNPLESTIWSQNLFLFNPNDPEQLELAKEVMDRFGLRVMPVLTRGNPQALGKEFNRPIFYANQALMERFSLKSVPAMIGVGKDQYKNLVAVTYFSKPFDKDLVLESWFGLPKYYKK